MKGVAAILLAALVPLVASTQDPKLPFDPATVSDCIEWHNNYGEETCEEVLSVFNITPEEFHRWNPSVDLNCQPWNWQSYCILTEEKWYNKFPPTSSSTATPSSTTSTVSSGPSPTAWGSLGCYVQDEDPAFPVLEENLNPAGDAALTVAKCQDSCYREAFDFAGVEGGNQCWCSSYVSGELAQNIKSCNSPCTGDSSTSCGGIGFLDVFKAQHPDEPAPSITDTPSTTASPTASSSTTPVIENSSSRTRFVNTSLLKQSLTAFTFLYLLRN